MSNPIKLEIEQSYLYFEHVEPSLNTFLKIIYEYSKRYQPKNLNTLQRTEEKPIGQFNKKVDINYQNVFFLLTKT